jgi:hypothetical protein
MKRATFPRSAFGPDFALMLLHDLPTDGEPQSRAAFGASVRRIDLLEAIENQRQLFGRDASALVTDGEGEGGGADGWMGGG